MQTPSHLATTAGREDLPYLSFDQITQLRRRRNDIRNQIDANPDKRLPDWTLDELRRLNGQLACELERQVALLVRLSSRVEARHRQTGTHGQVLQAQANTALKLALATHRQKAGGRSAAEMGYLVVETARLCGLDMVGADFLLIDRRSGKFLMIDVTADEKTDLPALRQAGLLHFKFFSNNLGKWGPADSQFYVSQVVGASIGRLITSVADSPLDLLSVRLPFARQEDTDRKRLGDASYRHEHIENLQACRDDLLLFLSDLQSVAAEASLAQRNLLEDFIRHTRSDESGALFFLNQHIRWLRSYKVTIRPASRAC